MSIKNHRFSVPFREKLRCSWILDLIANLGALNVTIVAEKEQKTLQTKIIRE